MFSRAPAPFTRQGITPGQCLMQVSTSLDQIFLNVDASLSSSVWICGQLGPDDD